MVIQARQLESAKTFTEQYSLPEDITITPILVANANNNGIPAQSMILLSSAVTSSFSSPVCTTVSAQGGCKTTNSTASCNTIANTTDTSGAQAENHKVLGKIKPKRVRKSKAAQLKSTSSDDNLPLKNIGGGSSSSLSEVTTMNNPSSKQKDIVHVIDPRSGHKTTIAKHIIKNNLIKCRSTASPPKMPNKVISVSKLNPDLDVILINSSNNDQVHVIRKSSPHTNGKEDGELCAQKKNLKTGKTGKKKPSLVHKEISKSKVGCNKRAVLAASDNKNYQSGAPLQTLTTPLVPSPLSRPKLHKSCARDLHSNLDFHLPPGISISAGKVMPVISQEREDGLLNLSKKMNGSLKLNQNQNEALDFSVSSKNFRNEYSEAGVLSNSSVCATTIAPKAMPAVLIGSKAKGKRSLHECIDGLQKRKWSKSGDHQQAKVKEVMEASSIFTSAGMRTALVNGDITISPVAPAKKELIKSVSNGRPNKSKAVSAVNIPRSNSRCTEKEELSEDSDSFAETATAARVRSLGSTLIKNSDALAAVRALVVNPEFFYRNNNSHHNSTSGSRQFHNPTHRRANNGIKKLVTKTHGGKSDGFEHHHNLFYHNQPLGKKSGKSREKVSTRSTTAQSKIRARLRVRSKGKPSVLQSSVAIGSKGTERLLRSRLLRKQNFHRSRGSGNPGKSTRSESDSSRSSSVVRGGLASSSRGSQGLSQIRDKLRHMTYHADYQAQRNIVLRISSASLSISGSSATPVTGGPSSFISSQDSGNGNLDKAQGLGNMAMSALKKRAMVKPLSPAVINGVWGKKAPRWSNGWTFEGEPFEARVCLKVSFLCVWHNLIR